MFKMLKNDVVFLLKYKIFHIYIFVLLMYSFVLMILEGNAFDYAKIYIILSDPLILGFFFVGGIVLIEKSEGIIHYTFTTPITPKIYLISKVVVLALTGSLIAMIICLIRTNTLYLGIIVSVFLGNVFFSLLGVFVVKRCQTVNDYIGYGMFATLLLAVFFVFDLLFPQIIFLRFNPISCVYHIVTNTYFQNEGSLIDYFAGLVVWIVVIFTITYYDFKKYVYGVRL